MERFDVIVVGGGMAGLSSAAFLSLAGRSVALFEKQDKVGGFASRFEHKGVRFDIGIEGVRELAPDSFLPPFLRWWGVSLPMEARHEMLDVHTNRRSYRIRGNAAREDLRAAFPSSGRRIDRFFDLNAKILAELSGGPAPKTPEEMGFIENMAFGMSSLAKRPNLMRYGLRNSSRVIAGLFEDTELARVVASKTFEDMVYLAVAHRWESSTSDKTMYPSGGIVAAPMPWAAFSLFREDKRFNALREATRRRMAFPSCFMSFIALDSAFDLGGANYIVDWADVGPMPSLWASRKAGRELESATAPLACIVSGVARRSGEPIAMTMAATLGRDMPSAGERPPRRGHRSAGTGSVRRRCIAAPKNINASRAKPRLSSLNGSKLVSGGVSAKLSASPRHRRPFLSRDTPTARVVRIWDSRFARESMVASFLKDAPSPECFSPASGSSRASASPARLADEGSDLDARLLATEV
jgi:hypothetical protein